MELPLYFNLYHSIITCNKAKEILEVRPCYKLSGFKINIAPEYSERKIAAYQKTVGDIITNRFTEL